MVIRRWRMCVGDVKSGEDILGASMRLAASRGWRTDVNTRDAVSEFIFHYRVPGYVVAVSSGVVRLSHSGQGAMIEISIVLAPGLVAFLVLWFTTGAWLAVLFPSGGRILVGLMWGISIIGLVIQLTAESRAIRQAIERASGSLE